MWNKTRSRRKKIRVGNKRGKDTNKSWEGCGEEERMVRGGRGQSRTACRPNKAQRGELISATIINT
ncbi:hypothetical protein E2C01_046493 [Portunus trituberculatus]|uniref:Uncharacterized protein n=1 Tax=Portunus trituberculatus TaxID=210409 RepID=A0A5B7FY21_PORTR|nr:hypothetical protein [Portunus trituberculatus]